MNNETDIHKEQALVELLKTKDSIGFNVLYDNYSPALFGVLLKTLGDKLVAEDVLQEVFVKIWNNIQSYDASKGRLYTWMLNIARNAGIDKLRSKDYKSNAKNQSIDRSVYKLNENSLVSKTDTIGLKKIVEQLNPDQYLVIDMLYFKGYSQSEAAEALGLPLGTIKTRARAALTQLRSIIKP